MLHFRPFDYFLNPDKLGNLPMESFFCFVFTFQIKDLDPIKQLSLEDVLRENLKTCASLHGEASFNTAVSRVHPSVFAQLQHALKMT
jgi:hypothetical protein